MQTNNHGKYSHCTEGWANTEVLKSKRVQLKLIKIKEDFNGDYNSFLGPSLTQASYTQKFVIKLNNRSCYCYILLLITHLCEQL